MTHRLTWCFTVASGLAVGFAASCARGPARHAASAPPAASPASASAAPAAPAAPGASQASHLHQVHRVNADLISGAVPEGDAAFDELKAMGVRTIISVDGMTPDVASAQARGIRYVHIPITYAQATRSQQLEIARAVRDLPKPIYLHCHHGKHRGPAAAASAAVLLGDMTPAEGVAFMKEAGTAPSYTGLYACVASAAIAAPADLDGAPAEFPAVRRAQGIVAAMVEVDQAYGNLQAIREAGWRVPADHPDLVPAAEAGRLTDNLRHSLEDPEWISEGEDFTRRMHAAEELASSLEEWLVRGGGKPELEAAWTKVAASCKDCHAVYRDHPR